MTSPDDWDNAPAANTPPPAPQPHQAGETDETIPFAPVTSEQGDGWGDAPVAESDTDLPVEDLDTQPLETTVPGLPPVPPATAPWVPAPAVPAPRSRDSFDGAPVAEAGAALPGLSVPAPELPEPGMGGSRPAGASIPFAFPTGGALAEDDGFEGAPVANLPGGIDLDVDPDEISDEDPVDPGLTLVPAKAKAPKPEKAATTRKKTKKGSNTIGGIRLTARDMAIMAFLARYRTATVGQLARRFETSETALRNRLPALERAGLITWAWAAQTKPKVWLITESGLATVGMNLTVPTIRWGQLRHTLGLVDMGIAFELEGETVLTEREIRAAATRYTPTKRIRTAIDFARTVEVLTEEDDPTVARVKQALTVPVPGRGFGHIPDMVLVRQPFPNGVSGSIAVELELTRKGLSEWKTVLTAYRDSNVFHQCYYFVMSSDIKRALDGVIKALGAGDKIFVVQFTPVDLTADPYTTGGSAD